MACCIFQVLGLICVSAGAFTAGASIIGAFSGGSLGGGIGLLFRGAVCGGFFFSGRIGGGSDLHFFWPFGLNCLLRFRRPFLARSFWRNLFELLGRLRLSGFLSISAPVILPFFLVSAVSDYRGHSDRRFSQPASADEFILFLIAFSESGGPVFRNFDTIPGAFAVSQQADFGDFVTFWRFRRVIEPDLDLFPEQIDAADVSDPVWGIDEALIFRHAGRGVLISGLFIFKAAHQSAAGPGNFRWIQAQVLCFSHFNGDGDKLVQELVAAQGSAADSDSAEHFRLIADADLSEFDSGAEDAGEVFDEFSEIDAAVCGKEEDNFVSLEAAFDVHEFHFEAMGGDFLFADAEGFFFSFPVVLCGAVVVFGSDSDDGPKRLNDGIIWNLMISLDAAGVFEPLRGLDDDEGIGLHLEPVGIEVVVFRTASKPNRNNFNHNGPHFFARPGGAARGKFICNWPGDSPSPDPWVTFRPREK